MVKAAQSIFSCDETSCEYWFTILRYTGAARAKRLDHQSHTYLHHYHQQGSWCAFLWGEQCSKRVLFGTSGEGPLKGSSWFLIGGMGIVFTLLQSYSINNAFNQSGWDVWLPEHRKKGKLKDSNGSSWRQGLLVFKRSPLIWGVSRGGQGEVRSKPEQAGRWLFGEDSGEEGGGLPLGPSPASPPPQTSIRDGVTLSMWISIFQLIIIIIVQWCSLYHHHCHNLNWWSFMPWNFHFCHGGLFFTY